MLLQQLYQCILILFYLIVLIFASKCPCTFPGFQSDSKSDDKTELSKTKSTKLFLNGHEKLRICTSDKNYQSLFRIEDSYNQAGNLINVLSKDHALIELPRISSLDDISPNTCDIHLKLTTNSIEELSHQRRMCPDVCSPVPVLEIPEALLLPSHSTIRKDYAVTCSMTFRNELLPKYNKFRREHRHYSWITFLLYEAGLRRFYECHETSALYRYAFPRTLLPYVNDTNDYLGSSFGHFNNTRRAGNRASRRYIRGMVVWIGSAEKYSLMKEQSLVLQKEPFHSSDAILGWTAIDELYPCSPESIKCYSSHKKYGGLLPPTNINFMSPGWGCAQRRPLRALSHILMFFTMDFLLLIDDDTFFNYALFAKKYLNNHYHSSSFTLNRYTQSLFPPTSSSPSSQHPRHLSSSALPHSSMLFASRRSLFFGEALGATGDRGHLSKEGFFVGGSGYFFNKRVLERLVRKEVVYFGYESLLFSDNPRLPKERLTKTTASDDPYRTDLHVQKLTLLQEGLEYSQKYCSVYGNLTEVERWTKDKTRIDPKYACIYPSELHPKSKFKIYDENTTIKEDLAERFSRVPLGIRLIDFCTNLMANENTCQHR